MPKCSFPPIIDAGCRLLILGSLPGEESLRRQQYYAHPRNGFWRVLAAVFGEPTGESYPEKTAFLLRHHVALWDTVQCAERQGSLDSAIQNPQPNDFAGLFAEYPGVQAVAFNGGASAALFRKLALPELPEGLVARLQFLPLPSTSPANARPLEQKLIHWKTLLNYL